MDRKLLETIIQSFDGGPVGVDSLAAAINEERDTIEDVIEPYLIQHGFLQRTPRGRQATSRSWEHLGLQRSEERRVGREWRRCGRAGVTGQVAAGTGRMSVGR